VTTLSERQLKQLAPNERASYLATQKHLERWGHLPPQHQVALRGIEEMPEDAVENHARTLKTDPVHFAAAKAYHRWAIGQEMSAEEYAAAVSQAIGERNGY
jgi:hypothetical protein